MRENLWSLNKPLVNHMYKILLGVDFLIGGLIEYS